VLLLSFTWRDVRDRDDDHFHSVNRRRERFIIISAGVLPTLLAAVVTCVTLIWMQVSLDHSLSSQLGKATSQLVIPGFILWGISVIAQTLLFIQLLYWPNNQSTRRLLPSNSSRASEENEELQEGDEIGRAHV